MAKNPGKLRPSLAHRAPPREGAGQTPAEPAAAERSQVDESVWQNTEMWQRTFDAVPDLIAVLDTQHRMVRVNQAMADRLGLTKEQCVGQTCYTCVHATDEPPSFCPHSQLLQDGKEHTVEVREEALGGDFLVQRLPAAGFGGKPRWQRPYCPRHHRTKTIRIGAGDRHRSAALVSARNDRHELLRSVTALLQEWSGCEAVGIRLREGEDFPYFETRGFPPEFVLAEKACARLTRKGNCCGTAQAIRSWSACAAM